MVGLVQGSGCVWLYGTGSQQLVHMPCLMRFTFSASLITSTDIGMGAVGMEAVPCPHDAGTWCGQAGCRGGWAGPACWRGSGRIWGISISTSRAWRTAWVGR